MFICYWVHIKDRQAVICDMYLQENENFVDDGIQIEPFNLDKEREEGYFDEAGNFVEYVKDDEIKVRHFYYFSFVMIYDYFILIPLINCQGLLQDAWLDNVEIDPKYAALSSVATNDEEEVQDLSSKDIAIMKRRIANVLEPGETVRPMFYHS